MHVLFVFLEDHEVEVLLARWSVQKTKRSAISSDVRVPLRKCPIRLGWSVSQTVLETEVDEKWTITEGFNSSSVISLQISDFPSFIYRLFIAAAFLMENEMISLRQYNARNNRFGQTFAEAWWAWLTIAEFHCGFSLLFFSPLIHLFICYSKRQWVCWRRCRGPVASNVMVQQRSSTEIALERGACLAWQAGNKKAHLRANSQVAARPRRRSVCVFFFFFFFFCLFRFVCVTITRPRWEMWSS